MEFFLYWLAVVALDAGLVVFAYLDRIYRELGRVSTGRVHANLDIFEAEIEPRLKMDRRRAGITFSLLANLWLVLVAVLTARGVDIHMLRDWEVLLLLLLLLTMEVLLCMHVIPYLLLARSTGRWLQPLLLTLRMFAALVWPLRTLVEVGASVIHFAEETPGATGLRVGTYDSRAVVVAWFRSGADTAIEELAKDHRKAKDAKDDARAQAIAQSMEWLQNLRHMQAFGNAPIHDVIERMKDAVAEEARKAGVQLVVRDVDIAWRTEGVTLVDLTEALLERCHSTKETREMALQMKGHPPIPLERFPIDEGGGDEGAADKSAEKAAARKDADAWLAILDAGSYAETWEEASAHFRDVVPKEKWLADISALRTKVGALGGRELASAAWKESLPDAPAGEYVLLTFRTTFATKGRATETVSCVREKDAWRVDGYFIR